MQQETENETTLTELMACRYVQLGCTYWVRYARGEEYRARRIREDHERHQCPLRHTE